MVIEKPVIEKIKKRDQKTKAKMITKIFFGSMEMSSDKNNQDI